MAESSIPRTVKNVIAGASNPHYALSTLRPKLPVVQYRSLLQFLPSVARRGAQSARLARGKFSGLSSNRFISALGVPFPKSYSDLVRAQDTLLPLPIENELLWMSERIGLAGQQISEFVSRKQAIEAAILAGSASETLELLDVLENDRGKSFFLIETRLAILQNFKGLEAQKKYLQTIRSAWNRGITPFVAYHVSQKLEFATNPLAFPERFVSVLNRSEIPRGMFEYLLYRVLRHTPTRDLWPVILTWEENAPLIDQYETLITALCNCAKSPETIAPALAVLRDNVKDPRIDRLLVLTGQVPLSKGLAVNEIRIRERIDSDHPEEALRELLEDPVLSVTSHSIPLEAICRADLPIAPEQRSHVVGTRDYIVDHLARVLRKENESYEDSLLDLVRFTDAFASFSMSRVTKPEMISAASDLTFDIGKDLVASFVSDSGLSPEYLPILPSDVKQSLIEDAAHHGVLLTPSLGRSTQTSRRVHNENQRSELNQLLDQDELELVIERIASSYMLNPHVLRMLPIDAELKPNLEKVVHDLITSLEKMRSSPLELEDLINAVRRAQTNLHSSIDTLKDWFHVPEVLPDRVYSMDEVIDIGLKQVKKLHPDFDPSVEREVSYSLGIIELPRFSDIFFIIFENIQRHAGVGHQPYVRIRAAHEEGRFTLLVENEMQPWDGIAERLEKLRSVIAAGQFQRVVSSEGGTGLVKLWNTLSTDKATLNFATAADRFTVELSIPVIELDGGQNESTHSSD